MADKNGIGPRNPLWLLVEPLRLHREMNRIGTYSWWWCIDFAWDGYNGWPFPWVCRRHGHKWNGYGVCDRCGAFEPA